MLTKENSYLLEYWDAIQSGQIIVGYYMRREIENLVSDLDNPLYVYDTKEAHNRIKFMGRCALQSKAPWYNKPLKLMLWQKAFFEVLYSFKMADTGLRRFIEALLIIARKNGKTSMMAGDALYDLMIGEGGNDICCASNDDRQCRILWSEIASMRARLDPKKQITSQNLVEIRNNVKNIKITRLSNKVQNMDGFNFSKCYIDEIHDVAEENATCSIYEACWRSMSAREQPLLICMSTEGFNRQCFSDKKIADAKAIIEGEIDNIHFLPFLFLQDSEQEIWQNEQSWFKSNPALDIVKKSAKLRMDIDTAKRDSGSRIHLLTKDFNIAQNSAKAWLNLEDYDYEQEPWTLEDFRGAFCLAAVDLAETTDLTACNLLFMRPDTNQKFIYSHYWLPEMKLQKADDKAAGADYRQWIKDGFISVCDGNDNDLVEVADWLGALKKQYGIKVLMCYYDQRFAKSFVARLEEMGIETEVIQQNKYTLSSPIKLLESDLKYRVINYAGNPVLKWCLSNASLDVDNAGRVLIVKQRNQPQKRIDGAVACAILLAGWQRARTDFERVVK